MLDDLRCEVGERSRMLLAARVGVGYFNRLIGVVFFVPVWLRHPSSVS